VTGMTSPQIRADHLLNLVDDVGIVQHAYGVIPNRSSGYCVDDVARLVIAALDLDRGVSEPVCGRILASSLAFLFHAWDSGAGGMRNFMDYDRRWLDSPHQGDHVGRAAWALGAVVADDPVREEAAPCLMLLGQMQPTLVSAATPRQAAYAILGLTRPEPKVLTDELLNALDVLADRLAGWYDKHHRQGWLWFEPALTYDNARLPQALIAAGARLGNDDFQQRGLAALDWYADQCTVDGDVVRLVGNRWRRADDPDRPREDEGDEQPIDAAALVEAFLEAATWTGRSEYGARAARSFEWFLGRNSQRLPVCDLLTGGCHDGLGQDGVNPNEGAESTLAFLQALLALENAGLQGSIHRLPQA
jgi:hypothetical protein